MPNPPLAACILDLLRGRLNGLSLEILARLVSLRRRSKQDASAIEDVKPDVLAIAGPTETTADKSLYITYQPAGEQSLPVDLSAALPIEPENSEETSNHVVGIVENDSAKPGPSLWCRLAGCWGIAANVAETAEATRHARRARAKKVEKTAIVVQDSPVAASVSDEMVSLDQEIAELRIQLASKLRLKSAQLNTMLARFER